ncbi:MAG TPA: YihY/virulence factor BrkB family protein [Bacteroidia bacterium]|nr:YihY/virulence factor BrkB family protein [Bacteroidia bacterium]
MFKLFSGIQKVVNFIGDKMWRIRLNKLDRKQGILIKQLRIITLAVKGFNEKKCLVKASALTYYMLFSIVPFLALLFAISKGFNLQQKLEAYLLHDFSQHADILTQAFQYADKMLQTTQGSLIAGVGIILLIYTVLSLLSSIENSFNEIWEIKKGRTFVRRITDYIAIMLFAPIFLFASSGVSIFLNTEFTNIESLAWLSHLGFLFKVVLKITSLLLLSGMFTFIYIVLPNTRVKFKSAMWAGIVAAIAFDLLQWAYIKFQIGAVKYDAVYGSFAALPLFLIWIQYSWFIVLFGAELSFANQNVDHYELETEIENISTRCRRVISLLIANLVVKNFIAGNPPLTSTQVAEKLDMPVRLARLIIFDFTETKIFVEVKTDKEKEVAYQPGISENNLTVKYILDKLDTKGVNELPIHSATELENIHKVMNEFDQVIKDNKGTILVKDIL